MIIHRTIFKDLLFNVVVIIFSLSIILFLEKFVRITRLFMGRGADLQDIAKIFIYLQPSILLLSVPMAILIAIFLVYGRMSADSEIIVLKGCGMNFFRIAKSALFLAVSCSLVLLFVSLYLQPRAMTAFKKTLYETIVKKASMTFEEETFSDVFKGNVIYVKEVSNVNEFRGIFVYRDADRTIKDPVVIVAEKGTFSSSPEEGLIKLTMDSGLIHSYSRKSSSEITFSRYELVLSSGAGEMEKTRPDEINTALLWQGRNDIITWAIEMHRRLALPFACIIFGVLAPALSSRMGKIGRLGGFSLSLGVLIFYYLILIFGESLAKSGKVPAGAGVWGPNIILSILAGILFYRAYRDKPVRKF